MAGKPKAASKAKPKTKPKPKTKAKTKAKSKAKTAAAKTVKPRDVSHRVGPPLCTRERTAPSRIVAEAKNAGFDEIVVIGVRQDIMTTLISTGNMMELERMVKTAWATLCEMADHESVRERLH